MASRPDPYQTGGMRRGPAADTPWSYNSEERNTSSFGRTGAASAFHQPSFGSSNTYPTANVPSTASTATGRVMGYSRYDPPGAEVDNGSRAQPRMMGAHAVGGGFDTSAPPAWGGLPAWNGESNPLRSLQREEKSQLQSTASTVFYGSMTAAELSQAHGQTFRSAASHENKRAATEELSFEQQRGVRSDTASTYTAPYAAAEHGMGSNYGSQDTSTNQPIFYGSMGPDQIADACDRTVSQVIGQVPIRGGQRSNRRAGSGTGSMDGVEFSGLGNDAYGVQRVPPRTVGPVRRSKNDYFDPVRHEYIGEAIVPIPLHNHDAAHGYRATNPLVQQDSAYANPSQTSSNFHESEEQAKMSRAQVDEHIAKKKKQGLASSRYA